MKCTVIINLISPSEVVEFFKNLNPAIEVRFPEISDYTKLAEREEQLSKTFTPQAPYDTSGFLPVEFEPEKSPLPLMRPEQALQEESKILHSLPERICKGCQQPFFSLSSSHFKLQEMP